MIVEPRIQAAEIEHSRRERPCSTASYDVYLRALAGIGSETEAGNAGAYALLRKGLERDPENLQLLALAAWAPEHRCTMAWPQFGPDDRQRCAEFARRALERAGGDAMILAHCRMSLLQAHGNATGAWPSSSRPWRRTGTTPWCWSAWRWDTCIAATLSRR